MDYMTKCMNKLKGKKVIWIGDINVDQNKINCPEYKKKYLTLKSLNMVQPFKTILEWQREVTNSPTAQ